MSTIKTGEVFDRDEDGLWLCESWLDEETGEAYSTRTLVSDTQEQYND